MRRLTSAAGGAAIPRRRLLCLAAAGLLVPGSPAMASPGGVTFRVIRKGTDIGSHQVRITPIAGGFTVDVKIELAVKLAMITVFYYRQTARDTWKDGNLVSADYRTDDDGKVSVLKVRENRGQLRIEGPSGSADAPLGTMTDLAFWNESIIDAPRVVDSQTGQVGVMNTSGRSSERITVAGREVDAVRYTVSGSEDRRGTVWYVDRQWVKASFVTRGEALEYVLA